MNLKITHGIKWDNIIDKSLVKLWCYRLCLPSHTPGACNVLWQNVNKVSLCKFYDEACLPFFRQKYVNNILHLEDN